MYTACTWCQALHPTMCPSAIVAIHKCVSTWAYVFIKRPNTTLSPCKIALPSTQMHLYFKEHARREQNQPGSTHDADTKIVPSHGTIYRVIMSLMHYKQWYLHGATRSIGLHCTFYTFNIGVH
jgi:hypothetical protein